MAGRNFLQKQKENQPNQIRIDAVVAPAHARALLLPWLEAKIKLVLGSSESAFLRLLDQVLKVTTGSLNASLHAFAHILPRVVVWN